MRTRSPIPLHHSPLPFFLSPPLLLSLRFTLSCSYPLLLLPPAPRRSGHGHRFSALCVQHAAAALRLHARPPPLLSALDRGGWAAGRASLLDSCCFQHPPHSLCFPPASFDTLMPLPLGRRLSAQPPQIPQCAQPPHIPPWGCRACSILSHKLTFRHSFMQISHFFLQHCAVQKPAPPPLPSSPPPSAVPILP